MSLLNQASLIQIPSGYKEDTLYSAKPINGDGDLTFTRASTATRVNADGLIETSPVNLLQYSEDISNAVWGNDAGNTKISNTTTAPNGTVTADTISAISGNVMNVYQIIQTNDGTLSYSVYLKKNATNLISIYIYQTFGSTGFKALGEINFDNGTFTASVGTGTIESVGNGWFRVTLTATLLSGANSFGIYTTSDTGTRNVYLWGAQANIGSTAKPYFPTTDRLNVPRLTYPVGGGCPSLLLEKQSTNNFNYSEQFDNGFWTTIASSITANNTTSPDGTQNAEKLTEYGNNSIHSFYNTNSIVIAATNTASIFYKKGTRRYFSIKLQVGTNSYTQVYDADGVTTGSSSSNGLTSVSSTIVSMGNGWVRATLTGTDPSGGGNGYGIFSLSDSATPTFDAGNFNPTYQGSTSEYGYFWGAQVEASSYPTSYISTTSSSATRISDVCNKYSITSLIGQTEGTIFGQVAFPNLGAGGGSSYIYITDGSFTNSVIIGREPASPNSKFIFYINAGGSNILNNSTNNLQSGVVKMAVAYKSGDWAAYLNGNLVASGSTTFTFSANMTRFGIGTNDGAITVTGDSMIASQAILFPTRLTNAELASLTTL